MRHVGLAVVGALVVTGCNAILGIDDLTLGDGGITADAGTCFGTLVPTCFAAVPAGELTLLGTLDTGSDPRCSSGPVCAIGAKTIVVESLVVEGTRPLVLVAVDTLTIAHELDANSTATRLGPGADSPLCNTPTPSMASGGTGGGGAGGSFGTLGGAGGKGQGGGGGMGGTAAAMQSPTALRGGCSGGSGAGANGGSAGHGGGAIALYAGMKIQINEQLRVSGQGGGGGGGNNSGGGGGGSGGMIVLEAGMIDIANDVFANGGGGGEGSGGNGGNPGKESSAYDDRAAGGTGGSTASDGGDGFASVTPAKAGETGSMGGGGGGGGAGVIWVHGTVTGAKISPTATPR